MEVWCADHMTERGLDALITQTARDFTGGYVKWFTDIPAYYPRTVVFHRSDLMTVVEHGPAGRKRSPGGTMPTILVWEKSITTLGISIRQLYPDL